LCGGEPIFRPTAILKQRIPSAEFTLPSKFTSPRFGSESPSFGLVPPQYSSRFVKPSPSMSPSASVSPYASSSFVEGFRVLSL